MIGIGDIIVRQQRIRTLHGIADDDGLRASPSTLVVIGQRSADIFPRHNTGDRIGAGIGHSGRAVIGLGLRLRLKRHARLGDAQRPVDKAQIVIDIRP